MGILYCLRPSGVVGDFLNTIDTPIAIIWITFRVKQILLFANRISFHGVNSNLKTIFCPLRSTVSVLCPDKGAMALGDWPEYVSAANFIESAKPLN